MHSDLIAKLEALDGPSREVDELIALSVGGLIAHEEFGMAGNWWTRFTDGGLTVGLPPYTASLDAAIALVERVLGEDTALELLADVTESTKNDTVNGTLTGIPIALLIAALKALGARDG